MFFISSRLFIAPTEIDLSILLINPDNTFPGPISSIFPTPFLDKYNTLSLHLTGFSICLTRSCLISETSFVSLAVTLEIIPQIGFFKFVFLISTQFPISN